MISIESDVAFPEVQVDVSTLCLMPGSEFSESLNKSLNLNPINKRYSDEPSS